MWTVTAVRSRVAGAIQVLPTASRVLLADCATTGGYPVIATVVAERHGGGTAGGAELRITT